VIYSAAIVLLTLALIASACGLTGRPRWLAVAGLIIATVALAARA
jgi:hypothetical protein